LEVSAKDKEIFSKDLFGPVAVVVKTSSVEKSIQLAAELASEKGSITCSAYTTQEEIESQIIEAMNATFTPVSINLSGFALVNQHAAFSDFHVTGGNPSGNASFTDSAFINRRFVWVGNRKVS